MSEDGLSRQTVFRSYRPRQDGGALIRLLQEVGWVDATVDTQKLQRIKGWAATCRGFVAEVSGEVASLVHTTPGTIRYLDQDLPLCVVSAVVTGRAWRRLGLGRRLTARAVAEGAERGERVAALGVFDQGYYDRLGFGNGAYDHFITFDPEQLRVPRLRRTPVSLQLKDYPEVHRARLLRRRLHGSLCLQEEITSMAMMDDCKKGFGLGFRDDSSGELTHFFWVSDQGGENGPYHILEMTFRNGEQLLELLSLIKSFSDQIHSIVLREPPAVSFQDFLHKPQRHWGMRNPDWPPSENHALAVGQVRLLEIEHCLDGVSLACPELAFTLQLSDPIEQYLPPNSPWQGVAGSYTVRLGPNCCVSRGTEDGLPRLEATVNAFSRLWLGVAPATGLAVSDELSGTEELLAALDQAFCLPIPLADWDI